MTTELPIVTQADRDAAKNAGLHFNDEHIIMQAFAKHRIASNTEAATLIEEMAEALRDIEAATARKQLPLTAQINQMAIDALAKVASHG